MKSIKHAVTGILIGLRYEKNFRVMFISFAFVLILNSVLKVTQVEWMFTLLCSSLVLGFELINSSLEKTLDLYSMANNDLIKHAKDLAAGGVLILSITSVLIGCIIYLPYVLMFI